MLGPKVVLTKHDNQRIIKFFLFIRYQFCVDCGGFDHWDEKESLPVVSASHVLAKGSTRRNEHYDNLIPQCLRCHMVFEGKTPEERLRLHKHTALEMTEQFNLRFPVVTKFTSR